MLTFPFDLVMLFLWTETVWSSTCKLSDAPLSSRLMCLKPTPFADTEQQRFRHELACRSFYHAGVFDGALDLFFKQLISSQPDGGLFDRFLIQCMLFHHSVLTCPSYKGTSSALEMSSAARSQVSMLDFASCRLVRVLCDANGIHVW